MSRSTIETIALLATAVLVCALVPSASFFGPDQVGILVEGRGVLHGALFPPGPGIGWTPFKLGPLFEWVTALGLLPRDKFADVIVLIAVIHGVSVLGWRRLFADVAGVADVGEARLAGWALALHPLAISSGCAPVSTSIVMPTTLVFVWGCVRWIRAGSARGFALACVGAALMVQAHITTLFLLPLLVVGIWRRGPIGRIGLAGLAVAILIVSPMALYNLRVVGTGPFQHAGTAGAPFAVALVRAATLEARVLEVSASFPATWRPAAHVAALIWSAIMMVGAPVLLRRRNGGGARLLVCFGFVVPTVCVVLIPRGALLLYLDSTVPFRAWLFAAGVGALAAAGSTSLRARSAATGLRVAALAAVAVLGAITAANRLAVADLGFSRVNLSRLDLREPWGRPIQSIGVLTLETFQALGHALDGLGAGPESIVHTWHGPWRWAGAQSAGVWIAESRSKRSASVAPAEGAHDAGEGVSFIVLHEDDRCPVPAATPVRAGRFRIYAFDNRLHVVSADAERLTATVEPGRSGVTTVQLVTDPIHGVTRLQLSRREVAPTATASSSGLVVWSTSIAAADGTTVTADLAPGELVVLQMRSPPDAYAFATAPR
jgi:hypothetical protein